LVLIGCTPSLSLVLDPTWAHLLRQGSAIKPLPSPAFPTSCFNPFDQAYVAQVLVSTKNGKTKTRGFFEIATRSECCDLMAPSHAQGLFEASLSRGTGA
jgi:hypothetical protein